MNSYIRLINNAATVDKKFVVLFEGFEDDLDRVDNVQRTPGGALDVQRGSTFKVVAMLLKAPYSVTDSNYGTKAELQTFYSYMPPKDRIVLIDHFGDSHQGFLLGKFSPRPVISTLDSSKNYWVVPLLFHKATGA